MSDTVAEVGIRSHGPRSLGGSMAGNLIFSLAVIDNQLPRVIKSSDWSVSQTIPLALEALDHTRRQRRQMRMPPRDALPGHG